MSIAAKITRLFDFVAGTRIKSADVDAELNQLVTEHNNLVDDVNAETGTTGIANGAVTTAKIADGAVTAAKLDPTLVQTDINLNTHRTLSTIDHPDGSITPAKLSFDPATQAELNTVSGGLTTHSPDTTVHVVKDGTLQTGLSAQMVNGVYIRNNAGSLEWSADNTNWNAAGGLNGFEFGLPLF